MSLSRATITNLQRMVTNMEARYAQKGAIGMSDLATALQNIITGKANAATTLAGYGITDAMTEAQINAAIAAAIGSTYKPAGTIAGTELVSSLLVASNFGNVYNISSDLAITAQNEGLFVNLSAGDKVKAGDDVGVVLAPATYTAASGTAVEGTAYYELNEGEYTVVEVETGESVSGYYTKDADTYLFNDFAGFVSLANYSTTSEMNSAIATAITGLITLSSISTPASTGNGNVITSINYDNTTGEIKSTKGITALQESDFEEYTNAQIDALWSNE